MDDDGDLDAADELVKEMDFPDWEVRAGDPSVFAVALTFLRNPHGDGDRATAEELASWGAFRLWTGGENRVFEVSRDLVVGW